MCGEQVDLGAIDAPVYIHGSREDHIVPWQAAYASTPLSGHQAPFVLGASGHIAGVINPPCKNKRSYWTNDKLPASADDWLASATETARQLVDRLGGLAQDQGGAMVAAPKTFGNGKLQSHRTRTRPLCQSKRPRLKA